MQYGDGEVFSILDTKSGSAHSYRAVKTFTREGELIEAVSSVAPQQEVKRISTSYLDYQRDFGVVPISIPSSYNRISGFENVSSSTQLITNPQLSDWIGQYLTSNVSLENNLEAFVGKMFEWGLKRLADAEIETDILVSFDNLSTARFTVKFSIRNGVAIGEAFYIEGSARFADGSLVPTISNKVAGNWFFKNKDDLLGFKALNTMWHNRIEDLNRTDTPLEECMPAKSECRETSDGMECEITYSCR